MDKDYFLKVLEESHTEEDKLASRTTSPLCFLGDAVFNFTTYDSTMSELFAQKAVDVCRALNNRSTSEFIANEDNYVWYLMMCNVPFFSSRISWGCSIRGAWWEGNLPKGVYTTLFTLENVDLFVDGDWCDYLELSKDEWFSFVEAVVEYAQEGVRNEKDC